MSLLMASSSVNPVRRYDVFPSFHGQDVRNRFLSHVHYCFLNKGIRTFKDNEIVRGHTIGPELVQAIRESRVSIVVLSKNYTSSSWCLDELVEIFKCKEEFGQIVMTIFYDVDPSDVRKQIGDFGEAFKKTCEGKKENMKQRWRKALARVADIAGEHSIKWDNEAAMIQKIAIDVSNKLNVTPSRDFEGMVGLEAHLERLYSLLSLRCDNDVKMIGIWGPAGIGKSTIARALYNQLSTSFHLKCFMGNLKGSFTSLRDDDSKLCLQSQLLSNILNHTGMKVDHLWSIQGRLQDQRVLIILDDVDDLKELETLAKDISWFGSGSRIIVTTEDKKILKAHGIQDIYHVDFPSHKEALEILCLSAFKQRSVQEGFEELANKVVDFCGNLPLGLCVVGSSLRGESKEEWELQLSRIESSVDGDIKVVLRVGYDRLSKKNQSLFLHIACFFNYCVVEYVISWFSDSNLDVRNGLNTLADRSLVSLSRSIKMHHLLQQLGRQIVFEQSDEPGKRQFLVEAQEIYNVLTNETGTGSVIGISLYEDDDNVGDVPISKGAFEGMPNLQFLRVIFGKLQIPKGMKYLPRLKLLHWDYYPSKSLPPRFQPDCLVELRMCKSNLRKLWGGIQPLPNLKTIDLSWSKRLKEIPNLSKATNLEEFDLEGCESLVELPSSISNLHKLKKLNMKWCDKLKVIPANINLASLEYVDMSCCWQLRKFPDISTNIKTLDVSDTMIEDVPPSIVGWSRLEDLTIDNTRLKRLTHAPISITRLDLSNNDIKSIPDCVTSLKHLVVLYVNNCPNLMSIPALSSSLESIKADHCVSLKRVCCSNLKATKILTFYNCLKLDEESKRKIIQQSAWEYICLPGKEIPTEFTHTAAGNSVTISLASSTFSASSRFKACFMILPLEGSRTFDVSCDLISEGGRSFDSAHMFDSAQSEHLFIFHVDLSHPEHRCHVTMSEITFKFRYDSYRFENRITIRGNWGVQIMTEEADGSRSEVDSYQIRGKNSHHRDGDEYGNYEAEDLKFSQVENIKTSKHTGRWSWLRKLGLKAKKMNKTE